MAKKNDTRPATSEQMAAKKAKIERSRAKQAKQAKAEQDAAAIAATPKAEHAKKYARMYEVLEAKGAKPVQLVDCRMANPGSKFRAVDILCFPVQLDTLLAEATPRIKAVSE